MPAFTSRTQKGSAFRSSEPDQLKLLYGVDGCRGGWIAAESEPSMDSVRFHFLSSIRPLFEKSGPDAIVAIDIPIGLPKNEPRVCDSVARRLLGRPRSSSVFSPPVRQALEGDTFSDAFRINLEQLNTGISKQTFFIMPKIREVDMLMTRSTQRYVREAHPEVTFAQLNGGRAMLHNKKTFVGRAERMRILRRAGVEISEEWLIRQRSSLPRGAIALDDMLDSMACLVTALHIRTGCSHALGRAGQKDARGLLMEIVTCDTTLEHKAHVKEKNNAGLHG